MTIRNLIDELRAASDVVGADAPVVLGDGNAECVTTERGRANFHGFCIEELSELRLLKKTVQEQIEKMNASILEIEQSI